ncbi:tetratricopeptide repeat protein [Gammaproteobacteria bacterium AB-CW1]|uniref:Tetratricopeptide repeat protein n=1 Tax=Natronospira elongata TaxID=3110268 RepID=A0AAP6JDS1_9GAMM|nr:tetratricopeptide repeat protein [Gammaproteobacteria bacterium AB-CW1]
MSLINQMLRDLEQQRDTAAERGDVHAVAGQRPRYLALSLAIGLALIIPIGVLAWFWLGPQEPAPVMEEQLVLPLETSLIDLAPAPEPPLPRLHAIERVETRDGPILRLELDGDSDYRRRSSAPDRLVLELRAEIPADIDADLPPGVDGIDWEAIAEDQQRLEIRFSELQSGPLYAETIRDGGERLLLVLDEPIGAPEEPATAESSGAVVSATEAVEDSTHDLPAPTETREEEPAEPMVAEAQEPDDSEMRRERRQRSDAERAAEAWSGARKAIDQGRSRQAESALQRLLDIQPEHVAGREALADLLVDQGRLGEAEQLLAEALAVAALPASDQGFFARQRARLWLGRGDPEQAVAVLEAVWLEVCDSSDTGALLAGLYYQASEYEQAAELYENLLSRFSQRGAWWMGLGLAREALGEPTAAIAAYEAALSDDQLRAAVREYLAERIDVLTGSP